MESEGCGAGIHPPTHPPLLVGVLSGPSAWDGSGSSQAGAAWLLPCGPNRREPEGRKEGSVESLLGCSGEGFVLQFACASGEWCLLESRT